MTPVPTHARKWLIALSLSSTLGFGCAHSPKPSLSEEIRVRKYAGDLVSVESALELARASYVLGCVEAKHAGGLAPGGRECMTDAEAHVRENVLFILDQ